MTINHNDFIRKAYHKMKNLTKYIRERKEKTIVTNTGGYIQIQRPNDNDLNVMKRIENICRHEYVLEYGTITTQGKCPKCGKMIIKNHLPDITKMV
jgi:PHP family Zn ribbon phosphoesterase